MEVKKFSFDEIDMLPRTMSKRVKQHGGFTHIVGIARGGLFPATILSYSLEIPLLTCNVSSYNDKEKNELKIQSDLNLTGIPKDSKLLVVDDICDTGETVDWISQKLTLASINYEVGCIFTKKKHVGKIRFFGSVVPDDKWIVFPWE